MKKSTFFDIVKVDEYSITLKYLQIANSIIRAIENKNISEGDILPSINELSFELDISRDTVERGYKYLKEKGIVDAVPRKGYFIKSTEFRQVLKIFLLFNKLSAHKKTIYDSFVETLGEQASIDFYIYNNDFFLFKKLLINKKDDYSYYVIIPHFIEGADKVHEVINSLPKEKLILLDKRIPGVDGEYGAAYENFQHDIYQVLTEALERLSKYHTLIIIFPIHSYYPAEILIGFKNFCQDNTFSYRIIENIVNEPIVSGEVYIVVMEDDLVRLIRRIRELNLVIGEQVGIIAYNEVPLKEIILNGITTISTDFKQMGVTAAELILTNSKKHVEIPFRLYLRPSL
jgi:DNA-binding transcriptional regulator YhcF (GntR family)